MELSPRETQIVTLIAHQGLFYKEISARLGISLRTVNFHVANAFRAAGVRNREDLVRWFFNSTSLDPDVDGFIRSTTPDPQVDQFIREIGPLRILLAMERLVGKARGLSGGPSTRADTHGHTHAHYTSSA